MAKAPAQRFQSAMEFHEAFARAIGEAPSQVTPIAIPVLERTEVMERPDFSQTPSLSSPPIVTKAPKRSHAASWTIAVAGAVVAGAVWMFAPFGAGAADAQDDPPIVASLAEERPGSAPTTVPMSATVDTGGSRASTSTADEAKAAATSSRAKPTPLPAAGSGSAKPVLPPASFKNIKLLTVSGARSTASDAALHFQEAEVSVQSSDTKVGATAFLYPQIAKATYVHARDPQWDPLLRAPAGKIDVPGILGRARHWLVLQSRDAYVILRLDGDDRLAVLKAFEDRTGIVVERPVAKKPD
jgi:hypothetical protein